MCQWLQNCIISSRHVITSVNVYDTEFVLKGLAVLGPKSFGGFQIVYIEHITLCHYWHCRHSVKIRIYATYVVSTWNSNVHHFAYAH